jgi:ABC-type polysaccharide/polyol phosphate export permease
MPTALAWREYRNWLTRYRRTWKGTLVIGVLNPLLFLVAVGVGIGQLVKPGTPVLDGASYLGFFAPGMLAAASMQNGIVEAGFGVSWAKRPQGSYTTATATPLAPADIFGGQLLYLATKLTMSAGAFLVVMVAIGATQSALVVLALPAAVLVGLAFATPTAAWAVTLPNPRRLGATFKWVVMPLYLFSGTFFAVSQMPVWLQWLAYVTPLWHGVELCRAVSLGTATWAGSAVHVAYLVTLTTVGALFSLRHFERQLHS